MPRSAITISKARVNTDSTNYRDAIDATNKHEFTPTDLNRCMILVSNTTAAEKTMTIEGLAGGDDIVLTLADGSVTEQVCVYDCSELDEDLYLQAGGEIYLEPAASMTGFVQVVETKPPVEIENIKGTGAAGANVELSTLDGSYGYFEPDQLRSCIIRIHNQLVAASNANDKKVWVKEGDYGLAQGVGPKIQNCIEASYTGIMDLDSSRHQNEDGTVHIHVQEGIDGTISVMEN